MNRCFLVKRAGLAVLAFFVLAMFQNHVAAQDWYRPVEPGVLEVWEMEYELRSQLKNEEPDMWGVNYRRFSVIQSFRISPFQNLEVNLNVPVVYSEDDRGPKDSRRFDFGDIHAQMAYELYREEDWALLVSLDQYFRTGRHPYSDRRAGTGSGHMSVAPGVAAIKNLESITVFAGAGFRIYESKRHSFFGQGTERIEPGPALRLRLGGAGDINPDIRATIFSTTDISRETRVDGKKVTGTGGNDIRVGCGLDWKLMENITANYSLIIGVTDLAPDAVLNAGVTYRF